MTPQAGVNGVLPVTALQKNAPASAPRGPKTPAPRLKLICRRLPPGLTRAEFETLLGEEWKVGAGRVDWLNYRKGKVSKEYAPPHTSIAEHILTLSQPSQTFQTVPRLYPRHAATFRHRPRRPRPRYYIPRCRQVFPGRCPYWTSSP
jgi:hypothetical protein